MTEPEPLEDRPTVDAPTTAIPPQADAAFGASTALPSSGSDAARVEAVREMEHFLDSVPTLPGPASEPTVESETAGRYEVRGEIGRGGMGAVLRGFDPVLGRELALKVLLRSHEGRPESQRRFLEEAQISGRLQHPGIVAVHDVGQFPDGRPFFAMKLVEGVTLAHLLQDRLNPSHDLPRFLQIFEQVCQTVGYAHSRGVIHRDLKPANVMVGAFGEVQVMDWGLAKVLVAPAPPLPPWERGLGGDGRATASPSSFSPLSQGGREGGTHETPQATRVGSVLGTPAYMAPEQARGEVATLDARADVFGLGALLCQILTGSPPYHGKRLIDLLDRAVSADLGEALQRLSSCGADPELVTLARDCLAPRREERPRDGGAVADRVTAYRAGVQERLRAVEIERAEAQARAEAEAREKQAAQARATAERRARHLTVGLAVAALLLVLLGGGGAFLLWQAHRDQREQQARQREEATRTVEADLETAARLQGQRRWAEALALVERLGSRSAELPTESLRHRVERLRTELEQARLDQETRVRLEEASLQGAMAGAEGPIDREGTDRAYTRAFSRYGLEVKTRPPEEMAERIRASAIREQLVEALDNWGRYVPPERRAEGERLRTIAALADGDAWRSQWREALRQRDWSAVRRQMNRPLPRNRSAAALGLLAEALREAGEPDRALEVLREVHRRHPGDFWTAFNLGVACATAQPPRAQEAVRFYSAALALRPESAIIRFNLGVVFVALGNWTEAETACREAVRLQPEFASAHFNLGIALNAQGKWDEAETAYREAVRLQPQHHKAHFNLGALLRRVGRLEEALVPFRAALRLRPDDATNHYALGIVLAALDRADEAVMAYREAIRLQPNFAEAHCNLGQVLRSQGQFADALTALRQGHALGSQRPNWPHSSALWVADVERLLALEKQLPAVLQGDVKLTGARQLAEFAELCRLKRFDAASVRFARAAFAAEPALANDLDAHYRSQAACTAVRATVRGSERLDAEERARLRRQALDWLRADLAGWQRRAERTGPADQLAVARMMRLWQRDTDLSGVRGSVSLDKLPQEEREAWQKFWSDVESLLRKTARP